MAVLQLEDGTIYKELDQIAEQLASLKIQLDQKAISSNLQNLLRKESLTEAEKTQVLSELESYFELLQHTLGYQSRDLIVLHPGTPNLNELLAKFDKIHTHAADEVRYVIDGEGVFGFVRLDGTQVELTIRAGEYINVPAETEHWFYLTPLRRIKAVRYFIDSSGWIPQYVARTIRVRSITV